MKSILQSSKLFKGSKYQSKILAAAKNPINQPLVKQVESYIDKSKVVERAHPFLDKLEDAIDHAEPADSPSPSSQHRDTSNHTAPHAAPPHHTPNGPALDFEHESETSFDEPDNADNVEVADIDTDVEEAPSEVEESTQVESTQVESNSILSNTYVTVETVAQAVAEIPGMLNLRDETKGVIQALLKSSTGNELWIYYSQDVDINNVLESVTLALRQSGYYYLEFNRVVRDSNAFVFTINWISNYFQPIEHKD